MISVYLDNLDRAAERQRESCYDEQDRAKSEQMRAEARSFITSWKYAGNVKTLPSICYFILSNALVRTEAYCTGFTHIMFIFSMSILF